MEIWSPPSFRMYVFSQSSMPHNTDPPHLGSIQSFSLAIHPKHHHFHIENYLLSLCTGAFHLEHLSQVLLSCIQCLLSSLKSVLRWRGWEPGPPGFLCNQSALTLLFPPAFMPVNIAHFRLRTGTKNFYASSKTKGILYSAVEQRRLQTYGP